MKPSLRKVSPRVKRVRSVSRTTLLRAAVIIANHAVALHDCHTYKGKWDRKDAAIKREYEEMLSVAAALCRMHNRKARK